MCDVVTINVISSGPIIYNDLRATVYLERNLYCSFLRTNDAI